MKKVFFMLLVAIVVTMTRGMANADTLSARGPDPSAELSAAAARLDERVLNLGETGDTPAVLGEFQSAIAAALGRPVPPGSPVGWYLNLSVMCAHWAGLLRDAGLPTREAEQSFDSALALAERDLGASQDAIEFYSATGQACLFIQRYEDAARCLRQAIERVGAMGDRVPSSQKNRFVSMHLSMGIALRGAGRPQEAMTYERRMLDAVRVAACDFDDTFARQYLAQQQVTMVLHWSDYLEYRAAAEAFQTAREIYRAFGDLFRSTEWVTTMKLGALLLESGDARGAIGIYQDALADGAKPLSGILSARELAAISFDPGDNRSEIDQAAITLAVAAATAARARASGPWEEEKFDLHPIATTFDNLGEALARDGRYRASLRCHRQALELDRMLDGAPAAVSYLGLARAHRGLAELAAAAVFGDSALALWHPLDEVGRLEAIRERGLTDAARGDTASAIARFDSFVAGRIPSLGRDDWEHVRGWTLFRSDLAECVAALRRLGPAGAAKAREYEERYLDR